MSKPRDCKLEYYQDLLGEWRWRVKAGNGEVIGAANEGYKSKQAMKKNVVLLGALFAELIDGDDGR